MARESIMQSSPIPSRGMNVFGKPVKSNWERAHTAFSVVQENQGASKGEIVATIADKIGRSEGTAQTILPTRMIVFKH